MWYHICKVIILIMNTYDKIIEKVKIYANENTENEVSVDEKTIKKYNHIRAFSHYYHDIRDSKKLYCISNLATVYPYYPRRYSGKYLGKIYFPVYQSPE